MVSQEDRWPARTAVKERNRDALLRAARELAAERGFAGTSVDAVAERAGLTKGAVYSIFGSKVELFVELLTPDYGMFGLRDVCEPGTPLKKALAAYGRRWAEGVGTEEARAAYLLSLELHLEALRQPEVLSRVLDFGQEAIARLAAELEEYAAESRRSLPVAGRDLAEAIVAALQGLTSLSVTGLITHNPDLFAATAVALLGLKP